MAYAGILLNMVGEMKNAASQDGDFSRCIHFQNLYVLLASALVTIRHPLHASRFRRAESTS